MAGRRHACHFSSGKAWKLLLAKTTLYAAGHMNRWYWRGSLGGVLPGGFDPEAIASQAIAEFLQSSPPIANLTRRQLNRIRRDLERRVRRHVNRLHHRSENRL